VLQEFQQKCFVNMQQMENFKLAMRMRARSEVEKLKVPVLQELAQDALDSGYSVPIFLNFTEPALQLGEALKCPVIYGGDTAESRQQAIDGFQDGSIRALVINIAAGAEAVSLHDLNGDRPRLSLINPSEMGTAVAQVLGRVHRVGAKSPATQKFIFAADSVEEQVAANMDRKIQNIGALTNNDMSIL
jgi:superfamily II DNA or RNA helicase